jgi:hypothetical protein
MFREHVQGKSGIHGGAKVHFGLRGTMHVCDTAGRRSACRSIAWQGSFLPDAFINPPSSSACISTPELSNCCGSQLPLASLDFLYTGNYESAVESCFKAGRLADALLIANIFNRCVCV